MRPISPALAVAAVALYTLLFTGLLSLYNTARQPILLTLLVYLPSLTAYILTAAAMILYAGGRSGSGIGLSSALRLAASANKPLILAALTGIALSLPIVLAENAATAAAWDAGTGYVSIAYSVLIVASFVLTQPRLLARAAGSPWRGSASYAAWLTALLIAGLAVFPARLAAARLPPLNWKPQPQLTDWYLATLLNSYTPSVGEAAAAVAWALLATEVFLRLNTPPRSRRGGG